MHRAVLAIALLLVVAACGGDNASPTTPSAAVPTSGTADTGAVLVDGSGVPPRPVVPDGELPASVSDDLDVVFGTLLTGVDIEALERVGTSGDVRVAWLLADLLRFFPRGQVTDAAINGFERLSGNALGIGPAWNLTTDLLIAWDIPAPPGYVEWKRSLFTIIEPAWDPFFADSDADVDWRYLSWGGVLIDDRPVDEVELPCSRGCIPALNDPAVTGPVGGSWYPDDRTVFGVIVNGEARAYPKNIMEVHEMVNDTLGGTRIGIPYCTLCGSAQAYVTDVVPEGFDTVELRTSGLLTRSNKVMFDLNTFSMFDTFDGEALTGPLHAADFQLEQISVITSTWADWKEAHPETTIVAQDGGLGRSYDLDPLGGRDDNGPIFPIGDVDARLPVQEAVLGVELDDGTTIAFPVAEAIRTLAAGDPVSLGEISVLSDGAGLVAQRDDGTPVVSHQAFWFAWSQFHPNTLLWSVPLS